MSWESSADYYRLANELVRERCRAPRQPRPRQGAHPRAIGPGFRTRYQQLGSLLGGELLGGTVYEFAPGEHHGPYHYEIGNEECLLVLAGTPTLRHPDGRDTLAAGDMVMFPDGPSGAHQLTNESTAVTRVLILSTLREPYGCAYPDSGKLSTLGGVFRIADAVDYWDGESAG